MIRQLEILSGFLNKWCVRIGGISLLLMMAIACANMVMRPLGMPLKGAYELVGFMGAMVVAFALGFTQLSHSHISVDVLSVRYSKRTNQITRAISSLVCALFFIVVAWQVIVYATTIWQRGETSETLRIIYHPFVYLVAFSCLLLSFTLLIDFLKSILPEKGKR